MFRQLGLAIGVAVLIAIIGEPRSPGSVLEAYRQGSLAIAAISVLAAGLGAFVLRRRPHRHD